MATLTSRNLTLLEIAKRMDPDGSIAAIVELLNQTNQMLEDMVWRETNQTGSHVATVRTGIPEPTWRRFNQYVQPTRSLTAQITFGTGMLEAFTQPDKALVDLNGNTAAARLTEDRAHLEGMNQQMATKVIFGDEASQPEAFTGLARYYNDLSAESADNVIDAGGTGSDNRSIYLVVWDEDTVAGLYPKGSVAGLQAKDLGEDTAQTSDGLMQVYRSHYRWDAGLMVSDWRQVVRICNIDKSDLSVVFNNGTFASGAHLPNLMFEAMRLIDSLERGRPAFYMSRDIQTIVAQQTAAAVGGSTLQRTHVGGGDGSGVGRFVETFNGIPMRRMDVLAADEARVT